MAGSIKFLSPGFSTDSVENFSTGKSDAGVNLILSVQRNFLQASGMEYPVYKLCFFVPESHLELVKAAVFATGAGRIGDYECCAWQTLGEGQFRPLAGSSPFIGKQGEIARVAEYKVEMVCSEDVVASAVAALRQAHPYEEPALEVWRIGSF